jgi:hypothetical protein
LKKEGFRNVSDVMGKIGGACKRKKEAINFSLQTVTLTKEPIDCFCSRGYYG